MLLVKLSYQFIEEKLSRTESLDSNKLQLFFSFSFILVFRSFHGSDASGSYSNYCHIVFESSMKTR